MRKNSVDPSQNDSDAGISLEVESRNVAVSFGLMCRPMRNWDVNGPMRMYQSTFWFHDRILMLLVVVAVALLYPQDAAVPANSSAAIAVAYGLTADLCVDDRGHNSDRCVRVDTRREMDCETTKTTYASLSNLEKNDESLALNGFH
ncbi:hypothetical protein DAPPUDRAFT_262372 [Daphnia pulex]|uniref:Uncharacterized protein n=1 Tax=Daphnia pulex TaxID=6669 RepID=E9HMV7_DAPPU|nr:hypothetical protein DAPPUDRAFT_262372 [Daphnia pulex]|eukprot:EFX66939.1 hypothetical protein DAPPUDRAFT_262372 [Daphnia pulex]